MRADDVATQEEWWSSIQGMDNLVEWEIDHDRLDTDGVKKRLCASVLSCT